MTEGGAQQLTGGERRRYQMGRAPALLEAATAGVTGEGER